MTEMKVIMYTIGNNATDNTMADDARRFRPSYITCDGRKLTDVEKSHPEVNSQRLAKRSRFIQRLQTKKCSGHDNSWTAALSLMKFCTNMYLDNL